MFLLLDKAKFKLQIKELLEDFNLFLSVLLGGCTTVNKKQVEIGCQKVITYDFELSKTDILIWKLMGRKTDENVL